MLGTAKTFYAKQYPSGSIESDAETMVSYAMQAIEKRLFYTAYEELARLRQSVPNDKIDSVTMWVGYLLMIRLGRIMDICDDIRKRSVRQDYSLDRRKADILELRALLTDCRDHKMALELMNELIESSGV